MAAFEEMVREVRSEVAGLVVARLRERLLAQPREWLVEQLLAELAPRLGVARVPEQRVAAASEPARGDSDHQVREVPLDEATLAEVVGQLGRWDAGRLAAEGCLVDPPPPGGPLIERGHRSPLGEKLLAQAKDLLHALLFGGPEQRVLLDRRQRELLTLTLPAAKAHVFGFLGEVVADLGVDGARVEPTGNGNGERASNVLMQVEFGETAEERVGDGIVTALRLINKLELNEVVLYARMEDVEQSTLI